MSSIHIKAVDPATLAALKRLARSHHRSLQDELRAILDRAARTAPPVPPPAEEDVRPLELVTVESGYTGSWGRDEIYDADR